MGLATPFLGVGSATKNPKSTTNFGSLCDNYGPVLKFKRGPVSTDLMLNSNCKL